MTAICGIPDSLPSGKTVLERNKESALATRENTVAVTKPKKLTQLPGVGQRLVYDDGHRSTGKVVEVGPRSMRVLFDDRMEPSLIQFDDPEWMDYITFGREGDQPDAPALADAEDQHQGWPRKMRGSKF